MNLLRKMWQDDEGQDLVEYALIGGLVSLGAIATIKLIGPQLNTIWQSISSALGSA